ncbi:hypothetical protein SAMN05443248_4084 [Bradyrhizobium erythrophlei]|uniref:Uncharacterized protein n=1 Tax=Bradyrhizobium erythrophlei TaxID=1437360 RepID=A0A1M5R4P1_9BRAD|nr:hypothetical protein SAMN05443248_4084 [Bradyrhizobium erythrophlei]
MLVTLHDAATYITGLPKKEAAEPEWQAAVGALMLVADRSGLTKFARIDVMIIGANANSRAIEEAGSRRGRSMSPPAQRPACARPGRRSHKVNRR